MADWWACSSLSHSQVVLVLPALRYLLWLTQTEECTHDA